MSIINQLTTKLTIIMESSNINSNINNNSNNNTAASLSPSSSSLSEGISSSSSLTTKDNENVKNVVDEDNIIKEFSDITGINDYKLAKQILSNHDFDVQSAVLTFLATNSSLLSSSSSSSSSSSNSSSSVGYGTQQQLFNQFQRNDTNDSIPRDSNNNNISSSSYPISGTSTTIPSSSLPTSSINQNVINNNNNNNNGLLDNIASIILHPLRLITGAQQQSWDEAIDSRRFIDMFERQYNHQSREEVHINFLPISYQNALLQAATERKPLFVYLHCGEHPNTDIFCRELLTSPDVCNTVNNSMIAWGGDIDFKDAYQASNSFQVAEFPFVAILSINGVGQQRQQRFASANIIGRIEGYEPLQTFLPKVRQTVQQSAHAAAAQIRSQQEAAERARILQEQQIELDRALEEDRRREEEERKMEEQIKQQQLEEEIKRKNEEEENEKEKQQFIDNIENKRKNLLAEPADSDKGAFTIRFQLPEGTKLSRRFPSNATLNDLRNYLDVELYDRKSGIKSFALSLSYPKRVFQPNETNCTLSEAGISQRSALYIQDLDA